MKTKWLDKPQKHDYTAAQGHEDRKLIVADGYRRVCAVYRFDEDAVNPCNIA